MSESTDSRTPYWANNKTARALWEAYLRMIEGKPKRVKPTARMTLSSVAVEAGFQRSTLSRKRYPDLAELIAKNASNKTGQTMHALLQKKRQANANLRDGMAKLKEERGTMLNRLAALERRHIKDSEELASQHGTKAAPIDFSLNGSFRAKSTKD